MTERFAVGLVVGKFAPLHQGHLLVIGRALEACERTFILSYSNPEIVGYEPERREAWLAACCPRATSLVITPEKLRGWLGADSPALPRNDAPDAVHRDFVALIWARVLGTRIDAVFTSEGYGEGFARRLTERFREIDAAAPEVAHVAVDRERRSVPISGTELRANLWRHWHYLPPPVARSLVERVTFLGGESSGKSVLAARMAHELDTQCVAEYGRELWEARQGNLAFGDLAQIAREHIRREEAAAEAARRYVFCDTSPLTTLFYSLDLFGGAEPELITAAERSYSLTVLCAPDFPFFQDGTRRDDAFRMRQHTWYEAQLAARGVAYAIARGPLEVRVGQMKRLLAGDQSSGGRAPS
jgi:HTH-type transcriptional regulator, transcriptional repressor of NAD biosynthesis genes